MYRVKRASTVKQEAWHTFEHIIFAVIMCQKYCDQGNRGNIFSTDVMPTYLHLFVKKKLSSCTSRFIHMCTAQYL